jgi:hypothetical protein
MVSDDLDGCKPDAIENPEKSNLRGLAQSKNFKLGPGLRLHSAPDRLFDDAQCAKPPKDRQ